MIVGIFLFAMQQQLMMLLIGVCFNVLCFNVLNILILYILSLLIVKAMRFICDSMSYGTFKCCCYSALVVVTCKAMKISLLLRITFYFFYLSLVLTSSYYIVY